MPTHDPEVGDILRSLSVADGVSRQQPAAIRRRRFLQGSLALGGAAALGPTLFADRAEALGADDRIIVCVYMAGGNDGLNTIAPLDSGRYHDARKTLIIDEATSHQIAPNRYLHPMLGGLASLYRDGHVAIVEGVGFPDDDHSHFSSIKTWMAANRNHGPAASGWLGRYAERARLGELGAVNIGDTGVPLLMVGQNSIATGLPTDGNLFGADVSDAWENELVSVFTDLSRGDTRRSEMASAWAEQLGSAIGVASRVNPIYADDQQERNLIRNMGLAANLINLDVGARVLSTSFQTFDTHDDQAADHAARLKEFDDAVARFYANLKPKFRNRVVILTFSEFGRRVAANDSRGTDHGTAGPMMMIGPAVKAGFHGSLPSLKDLDERGDLKHTVDFRDVYATVLDQWLKADHGDVLDGRFQTLDLFGEPGDPVQVPQLPETSNGAEVPDNLSRRGGAPTIRVPAAVEKAAQTVRPKISSGF